MRGKFERATFRRRSQSNHAAVASGESQVFSARVEQSHNRTVQEFQLREQGSPKQNGVGAINDSAAAQPTLRKGEMPKVLSPIIIETAVSVRLFRHRDLVTHAHEFQ